MATPILATKLYIPPPRPKVVLRPGLIERLNEGLRQNHGFGRKLTLVSAAAGFGKTTLVSEWIATLTLSAVPQGNWPEVRVAWLSLDEGDSEPARFLAYLVAALQTIATDVGKGAMGMLQGSPPPPIEAVLTVLLNEIATVTDHFILVLDDYHVVDSRPIDEALTFLLDHLPPQMHLVIATREDPNLPLARLRARGQLTELRAAELRFTPAEAAEFLNRAMGLYLSAEDIAALEARTEGWIAGLQLAALALQGTLSRQGRSDTASFIQAFTGSHRFVLDYLVEEVLQSQPERVRRFLLQTAILDRLSGPLCDAVCSEGTAITEDEDGRGMLEALERSNLFVVPLDDQRQWYRYHHLFAEVLQARSREAQPKLVSALHRRASTWYEQNGLPAEAIRHALAAKDFERAAGLIELAWSAMDINYQSATWLGWAKALPDELIRARPVLSVGYAWALLDGGEIEGCEAWLREAERWLDTPAHMRKRPETPAGEMVVVDEEQFRSLPASIATARAYRALALDDVASAVKYARQALDLTPEHDYVRHIQATSLLGLAQHASGDLESADGSLTDFLVNLRQSGDLLTVIGITFVLANIKIARGRLHEAASVYKQALQLAAGQGEPMPIGTADLYRGISELDGERGDLEAAAQHLLTSKKLGEQGALTGWQSRLCVAEARIKQAQGDLEGALEQLNEAERQYIRSPLPDVRPIAALRAQIWVAQGRLTEALAWARERGLSTDDDLSYLREFEHITLARVLIARYQRERVQGAIHEAIGLLERLRQSAEEGGRMGSVIEILTLQALAHEAQGDRPLALASLEGALTLAEPEGHIRVFVDEGLPMVGLLTRLEDKGGTPRVKAHIRTLLTAFGRQKAVQPLPPTKENASPQPLVEPLSERELEVLRLLRTELNGPEMARKLSVSLNTLRTHTKNIYTKLAVNNRRAAVLRAEELDLS